MKKLALLFAALLAGCASHAAVLPPVENPAAKGDLLDALQQTEVDVRLSDVVVTGEVIDTKPVFFVRDGLSTEKLPWKVVTVAISAGERQMTWNPRIKGVAAGIETIDLWVPWPTNVEPVKVGDKRLFYANYLMPDLRTRGPCALQIRPYDEGFLVEGALSSLGEHVTHP
jgi:hypothetical protein